MPLVKRAIAPVFISRAPLDPSVSNELEGVSLNTFAGIVRQLSNLSWHAENLFGELFNEANVIYQRANSLRNKISGIKAAVVRLDPVVERVSVEDIVNANHFKSSQESSQQILHRSTLPTALKEVYGSCSEPPTLNEFTKYRDDSKEGLKFYTDSDYFVRLWVEETTKQTEKRRRKGVRKNRGKRSVKPDKQIQKAQRKKYDSRGKEFQEHPVEIQNYSAPPIAHHAQPASPSVVSETRPVGPAPTPDNQQALSHPSSAPPPPPPPPAPGNFGAPQQNIPPPPPPPPSVGFTGPPSYREIMANGPTQPVGYPSAAPPAMVPPPPAPPAPPPGIPLPTMTPAPPPPPPPGAPMPPPPPGLPPVPGIQAPPPPPIAAPAPVRSPEPDPHSDLLSAIRLGKQLRKVDRTNIEVKKTEAVGGFDVASILARRIAVEMSDTDSDDDESGSDEDDWD